MRIPDRTAMSQFNFGLKKLVSFRPIAMHFMWLDLLGEYEILRLCLSSEYRDTNLLYSLKDCSPTRYSYCRFCIESMQKLF